jgi:predicted Zn-dependent peptidase
MVNKRTVIESSVTHDKVIKIEHSSGLDILICEMEGFSTTEALFGTKYGSINTTFKTQSNEDYITVPEGIAHYLEHKLFENEDTDVFNLYAETGASANAFTSFDKTCYLFSCSENYLQSLPRKPLTRNKALSGKRFKCATTTPHGECSSIC